MTRAPFAYFGGKHYLLSHILPLLPPHEAWVELFCGSAVLTLAKEPAPCELINDLDDGIVNFYRVLRDPVLMPQLVHALSLTPYARDEYQRCRYTWQEETDHLERARAWFVMARQSFAGKLGWGGWSYTVEVSGAMAATTSKWLSAIEGLEAVHRRLQGVQIEHRDWQRVLDFWNRPGTLVYVDPPYVWSTRGGRRGYTHEMTDSHHEELVAALLTFRGHALVSGYAHPLYAPLERAGWQRRDIATSAHSAGRTSATGLVSRGVVKARMARTETLWMNYDMATLSGQGRLFAGVS